MVRSASEVDYRPARRNLLIDRRGRTLPLLSVRDLPDGAPALVIKAVRMANLHRYRTQAMILLMVWGSVILLSLFLRYFLAIRVSPILWWMVALVIAYRLGSYGGRRMIRTNAMNAYTLCLAADICPSCGYGIAGVPLQDDGNTICPECAGAWKAPVNASPPAPSTAATHQTPRSASSHPA